MGVSLQEENLITVKILLADHEIEMLHQGHQLRSDLKYKDQPMMILIQRDEMQNLSVEQPQEAPPSIEADAVEIPSLVDVN